MKESGIYCIKNTVNGKLYIGSAVMFCGRFASHLSLLRKNKHHSPKLQHAWNKYGEDAFCFEALEVVTNKDQLINREQVWIDRLNSSGKNGYNIAPSAGSMLGFKHTEESKRNISNGRKGITPVFLNPEERRRRIGDANRLPDEKRAEIIRLYDTGMRHAETAKMVGVTRHTVGLVVAGRPRSFVVPKKPSPPISEATRKKLSLLRLGVKQSPELIAKRAAACRGRVFSEETKAKIAAKATGRKMSPEAVEKMASTHRGIKQSAEHIGKRTAKIRGKKMAPGVGFKRWETRRAKDEALSASLF
jgi:group I intron endonuclease